MQSDKLNQLPPYLFAGIDRQKRELRAKGADIIDLSIGDPDLPTPNHIIATLCEAAKKPKNHRYPPYSGIGEFREAAAGYLARRGIELNADNEILTLIGSKEGIAHAPFAFLNPGDVVLVPSPGYPVYSAATTLAGAVPYELPLKKESNFLPDLSAIPQNVLKKARLFFLNYPNNPTSAVATKEFFEEAVRFAQRHNILICHDAAYIEMVYDGYKAPSILEVEGANEVAIEFHSLSKTYNMTGWRIGFAAGNEAALAALGKFKANMDSSATAFVQEAGAAALAGSQVCVEEMCTVYKKRRDVLINGLKKLGFQIEASKATFYIWADVPKGTDSRAFASKILERTAVVVTPGVGFGTFGEGFIRFSLTASEERISEAVKRLSAAV